MNREFSMEKKSKNILDLIHKVWKKSNSLFAQIQNQQNNYSSQQKSQKIKKP